MMLRSVLLLASAATAFVAPASRVAAPRTAPVITSTAAEVSIAASQQLISLAVLAVGEGAWASQVGGFQVSKAIQCLGPAVGAAAIIVAASGSVSSGVASTMAPGLAASTAGCMVLLASYGSRLAEKQTAPEGMAPPKEIVGLFLVLAFFGFSTAVQSFFAADVVQVPSLPSFGGDALPDLPAI